MQIQTPVLQREGQEIVKFSTESSLNYKNENESLKIEEQVISDIQIKQKNNKV